MHMVMEENKIYFAKTSKISKIYKEISNIGIGKNRYDCYT